MIMSRYFSFLPVLLCIQLSIRLTTCKPFFVLMAPNILRAGNEETIVIQCHECENYQTVDINVNTFQDKLMFRTVVNLHESNNFLATAYINIPPSFLSSDITEKQYVVVQATSKEITLKRVILLSPDTGHIFIQTSKTIYTPKQNVNYRIFSTDKNLDPTERDVVIMLENPEGIIVNKNTRKIKNGTFAFTMKIPELVTFGMWKLVAKFENAPQREYTTQFEVREYVLPTFSVELDTTKKFFYYKDDKLVVNIKANYLFGENVNGYAVAIFGLYKDFLKILHGSMQREQIVKGEGKVTLTRKQLLEGVSDENELLGVSIYVNVTVFSLEGDYVQVHKTNIKIVSSPYNIAITRTPTYFKPGMPLKIMVLVTNPDMTPAVQIPVACGKELGVTSEEGLAHITVNTQGSDKDLEITVRTAEKGLPVDQQASVTLKATAYQSPYRNFLHINANLDGNNVAEISLYIKSQDEETKSRIKYFTILVISRGKILLTKIQKRTASEAITSLRITLTPEMLPSFRIVAYYYLVYLNSLLEIVSDSIWLHMKRTCKSNLQINPPKISRASYEPETKVELSLTGDQGSQVGLVVVDKAVFVLNNKGRFTQDKIWDEVQEDDLGCSAGSGENALGVFEDAGLDFGTTMKLGTPSRKDFTCTTKLHNRKRRSYELLAAKQKKAIESPAHLRPCCLAGLHESPMGLDCTARKKHVQEQECADLFFECCIHAEKVREQLSKDLEWERSDDDEEDVPDEASPRSFFPESWLWQIYELKNPKSDQKSSIVNMPLTLNLPSSITTWIVQAVSIKKNQGICVSNAYPLTVSMKLFVDLRMPYSVRRNEQVQIRAVVHNYLDNRRKVTVKFPYIENVCSLATKSRGYQVQVQVEAQSTKVVNYVIIPLKIETIHIEVQVSSSGISDKVKKSIDVLPEGKLERKKTFSQAVNPEGRSELLYVRKEELDGIVPDTTASYFISVQGDIMGESLLGILDESYLGRLLNIPSGCPEQNMFKTSTNVIATRYLDANKKWGIVGAEKRLKAIDNIGQGYIQQLAHRLPDHSFKKSTWLTAYVVKIFAMAYGLVGIDEHMLCDSLKWLATKQNPSGEFIESGEVYTKSMQGGYIESESSSSLTAFVLIALAEAKERCDIKEVQDAMQKAKKYLEKNLLSLKQTYSAVITSYALALVGSTENEDFIDRFADKTGTVWEVEKSGYYTVEATGYALLQKLKRGKYEQAQKIANWLVGVRSFGGGYASTQATVVALQALTQYKTDVVTDADVNLNVKLVVEGRADPVEYTIINNDAYLERTEKIPGNRDLNFTITGHGECTVTVMTVYYSLLTSEKKCNGFMLQAEVTADERKAGTYILKMQIRYNDSVPATMTLIEITMLTGFTPNIEDLKRLSSKVENYIMTYETQESTSNASVVLYLTKVPHNEALSIGFRIHQTTEVGLLQPADISIYEYYDLDKKCSTFYNLPDESWQLRKLCKGSACKCATGACASLVKGSEELNEKACSEGIDFVFRVRLTKTVRESSYDYNDVTIVDIIKDDIKTRIVGATMKLVSHMVCNESLNLQINSEYLIMNHYSDLWEVSPLTSFVLSSKTFIFDWSEGDETLTEFASNMKVQGCST